MKISCVLFLCFTQCILFAGFSVADEDTVSDSAATVKFDFAHHCKVGDFTFRFETTTLDDIIHALGSGVIMGNGKDAGESELFVDFQDGENLIRFSSNAEMGGEDHRLGGVEVRPLSANEKRSALPSLGLPVKFQFGSIGRPFSRLETLLGPAVITEGVAWYRCSGKKAIKDSSGKIMEYDVSGALRVQIVEGKVVALHVWHVTSS